MSAAVLAAGLSLPSAGADERSAPTRDFSQAEAHERLPGGAATSHKKANRNAFSHASANMSFARELDFKVGNGFFKRLWVSAPASTKAADGLGPLYNARACQRCHLKDGRGHPPEGNRPDDNAVSMFLRLSVPPQTPEQQQAIATQRLKVIAEPTYGGQLQDFAIPGHKAEGQMHIEYSERPVTLGDGSVVSLRHPSYSITDLGYGPLHPETLLSPRVAPPMIGLGLLELISEADILAKADPQDSDRDGVSGKPNRVWSAAQQQVALGRFGWKAGAPSIDEQNQDAFAGDIGISTPLHPAGHGECSAKQARCQAAINGNDPQYDNLEADQTVTDLVLFYARHLAVPARRKIDDPQVLAGKRLFYESGCIACHTPKFITGAAADRPELSQQLIWPYSDLLLHDMGEGLADHRPEGLANGREWRTPPLWGIGLTETVSGHSYFLHDGRARNLLEAVLWHGGEAQASRDRVAAMTKTERDALLAFLNAL
jgi:CxxC motif-containing protein (DUF1111 family)